MINNGAGLDWAKYASAAVIIITTWTAGITKFNKVEADVDKIKEVMPPAGALKLLEKDIQVLSDTVRDMKDEQKDTNRKIDDLSDYLMRGRVYKEEDKNGP